MNLTSKLEGNDKYLHERFSKISNTHGHWCFDLLISNFRIKLDLCPSLLSSPSVIFILSSISYP